MKPPKIDLHKFHIRKDSASNYWRHPANGYFRSAARKAGVDTFTVTSETNAASAKWELLRANLMAECNRARAMIKAQEILDKMSQIRLNKQKL